MTDIQAALGSMQMNRADEIIKERKSIAKIFDEEFKNLYFLQIPTESEGYSHGYQSILVYLCLMK